MPTDGPRTMPEAAMYRKQRGFEGASSYLPRENEQDSSNLEQMKRGKIYSEAPQKDLGTQKHKVRLKSRQGRRSEVTFPAAIKSVHVAETKGKRKAEVNVSWGFEESVLWVSKGLDAAFRVVTELPKEEEEDLLPPGIGEEEKEEEVTAPGITGSEEKQDEKRFAKPLSNTTSLDQEVESALKPLAEASPTKDDKEMNVSIPKEDVEIAPPPPSKSDDDILMPSQDEAKSTTIEEEKEEKEEEKSTTVIEMTKEVEPIPHHYEVGDMVQIVEGTHVGVEATLIQKLEGPADQISEWSLRLGPGSSQGGQIKLSENQFEPAEDKYLKNMGRKPPTQSDAEVHKDEDTDEDEDEDYSQKPKYLKNRDGGDGATIDLNAELEAVQPFEKFDLCRAQRKGNVLSRFFSIFRRGRSVDRFKKRVMGKVKGVIQIRTEFARDLPQDIETRSWFTPVEVVVRVYVLRAYALRPMSSFFKRVDPYIKIQLGDTVVNDKKNHLSSIVNPEFYRSFEVATTLPGVSQLHISVWDHNWLLRDSMIGETTIDLEDRWFCSKWQQWGEEYAVKKAGLGGKPALRVAPKPLETMTLRHKSYNSGTGDLFAWVDILTKEDARKYPMTHIEPPPARKFQLRVIVWRTKHVPYADKISHLSDLFCRVYIENGPPPQRMSCIIISLNINVQHSNTNQHTGTDIHWRCATGKGSFNWRMLIDIDLPHKYPLMRLQCWDQDLVTRNDLIGEASLDLRRLFGRGYKYKNKRINLFKKSNEKKRKKARAKQEKRAKAAAQASVKKGLPLEKVKEAAYEAARKAGAAEEKAREIGDKAAIAAAESRVGVVDNVSHFDSEKEEKSSDSTPLLSKKPSVDGIEMGKMKTETKESKVDETKKESTKETKDDVPKKRVHSKQDVIEAKLQQDPTYFDDEPDDESEPLISKDKQKALEKGGDGWCEGIVTRFRKFLGGEDNSITPEDAQWIPMFRYDPNKHKKVSGGAMLVSMELVPEDLVKSFAAGKGRSAPNALPAPTGRISLSLNPFRMIYQIMGPYLYHRICFCLATLLAGFLGYYFYDSFVSAWLVFESMLGSASDYSYIFFLMFILALCCVCCCSYGICMTMGHKKECKCCGVNCSAKGGKYCGCCC